MQRSGFYYDVTSLDGLHGLVMKRAESLQSIVKDIDGVVSRAKELGYNEDEK